jgi:hypothetical protein
MSEELKEIAGGVAKRVGEVGLAYTLQEGLGLDLHSSEAMASVFSGLLSAATVVMLQNGKNSLEIREQREADKTRQYLISISKLFSNRKIYEVDSFLSDNPTVKDAFERVIRNVEQDRIEGKLSYYVNLTNHIFDVGVKDFRIDEAISFANCILQMNELDFKIMDLMTVTSGAVFGVIGTDSEPGSLSGGGPKVTWQLIHDNLRITNISVGYPNRNTEDQFLPFGMVDASINKLIGFGYITSRTPTRLGPSLYSDPESEYRITALGYRFDRWCSIESSGSKESGV